MVRNLGVDSCVFGGLLTSVLLLAACAFTPMEREEWQRRISGAEEALAETDRCCSSFGELEYVPVNSSAAELRFDIDSNEIIEIDGNRYPVLAIDVSDVDKDKHLEIVSYSDKRRTIYRYDKLLFLRPDLLFLDEGFEVLERISSPVMCNGGKGAAGLWLRTEIPADADSLLLFPTLNDPTQLVNTRQDDPGAASVVGPLAMRIADDISEANDGYRATVYMGLEGLVTVEAVHPEAPRLGYCLE